MDEKYTDVHLREIWKNNGGMFHGPHIETGTMPESKLLPMLKAHLLASEKYWDVKAEKHTILSYFSAWLDDLEECQVSDIEEHIKTAKKMIEFYVKKTKDKTI